MKKATIGQQSRARVISAWPFKSSKGTTTYETQLHEDGVITCNCPGWVTRVDRQTGLRNCKHCREVEYVANEMLQGRKAPAIITDSTVAKQPVKIIEKVVEKIVEKKVYVKEPTIEIRGSKRLLRAIPVEE